MSIVQTQQIRTERQTMAALQKYFASYINYGSITNLTGLNQREHLNQKHAPPQNKITG